MIHHNFSQHKFIYVYLAIYIHSRPSKTLQNKYDRQNKKTYCMKKETLLFHAYVMLTRLHKILNFMTIWVLFISGFLLQYTVLLLGTTNYSWNRDTHVCALVCFRALATNQIHLLFSSFNLTLQLLNKALFYYILLLT